MPQSVSPAKGDRGSTVLGTITGRFFEPGVTVKLKKAGQTDITATVLNVPSQTRIDCRFPLPANAAVGTWDLFVQNQDTQSGTLAGAFIVEYPPPALTSVDPNWCRVGWEVNIQDLKGTGFRNGAIVRLKQAGRKDISATNVVVASATKITCTFDFTGSASGQWDLYVRNDDGKADTMPGAFTVYDTPTNHWYLAEGSTSWGFDTYMTIANPTSMNPATAYITYMTDTGPLNPPAVNLPAYSQTTINPRDFLGDRDFSVEVWTGSSSIALDRTMSWTGGAGGAAGDGSKSEAHSSIGVTGPAKTWYLPEGSTNWGFETWLCIQNPNRGEAEVTLTYMLEGAAPVTKVKTLPALSRGSYSMFDDIGSADASVKVTSNVDVIAERSMYRNGRGEGHCSVGTTTAAADYYLAEGTSAWGFTTYLLVQNPGETAAEVTVTYMTASGPMQQPSFNLPANSRKTVRVNDALPGADFSTGVHANVPIIAERAMYWGEGAGESCHDSIGMSDSHYRFYLPDGQTSDGRETWTLVQNPNAFPVDVEITYMTPDGTGNVTFNDTIPASSRMTYSMADKGITGRAAIMVASKTPGGKIMVERAMYWGSRSCGTDTIGGYEDIL